MTGDDDPTKVAIACQGGGSHTAFTAGVLATVFREWDEDEHDLVGLSGSSGGAFDALVAWHALVTEDKEAAADRLESLWADLAAADPFDRMTNDLAVLGRRVENSGLPVPNVSPYALPFGRWGQERIRSVLERHVDFDAIPGLCAPDTPQLVVGTVDVEGGRFETFVDEAVTSDAVLASGAVPDLFPGVEIDGHVHWDGLFSQNPPLTDLLHASPERKPDEIWIVQINPQERRETPRTLVEIADRRNELAGNISLNQQIRSVKRNNEWIEEGYLPRETFSMVGFRRIEIERQYDHATKLDRRSEFVEELLELGRDQGEAFCRRLEETEPDYFPTENHAHD